MAFLGSYIVPKKYIESGGLDNFLKKPVGTGPYKLAEYELNSRIVLERNDNYWGPKAEDRPRHHPDHQGPVGARRGNPIGPGRLHHQCPGARGAALSSRTAAFAAEINPITRVILLNVRADLGIRRQERAPCRASRHRQSGAVEGILRRRRRAAVGVGDAGNARLSHRFHISNTIPSLPNSCWPSRASRPTSR